MSATVAFFESWPICRSYNPHHDMFDTHDLVSDYYVTDMDGNQGLRHVLADGACLHLMRRAGIFVEIMACAEADDDALSRFRELVDSFHTYDSLDALTQAIKATPARGVRLVFVRRGLSIVDASNNSMSASHLAANTRVTQTLATNIALDVAHALKQASDTAFYALAYETRRYRSNQWEASHQSVAFVPSGFIANSHPCSVPVLMTSILASLPGVDAEDSDLYHHNDAAVTLDDTSEEEWRCTCRLHIGDSAAPRRIEVERSFPPRTLDSLPHDFLQLTDGVRCTVYDLNDDADQNLAADEAWRNSKDASTILAACLPALRDAVRRRTVPQVDLQSQAVAKAMEAPIEQPADAPLTAPIEIANPEPPPADPPRPTLVSPHEAVIARVRASYGDANAALVAPAVQMLDAAASTYTLILSTDMLTLQGALPPTVLLHISKTSRLVSLPLVTENKLVRLYFQNNKVRVGSAKLDLDSFLQCDWIVFYKTHARPNRPTLNKSARSQLTQRGSVRRLAFARARELMHR